MKKHHLLDQSHLRFQINTMHLHLKLRNKFLPSGTHQRISKTQISAVLLVLCICPCYGYATYDDAAKLYTTLYDGYNVLVRPVLNQTEKIRVHVSFNILSIVALDDISQRFVVNGFLNLTWTDELLRWNYSDNGIEVIHPPQKMFWRPKLFLVNTMEERDIFEEEEALTILHCSGVARWYPGALFPVSCKLDMSDFPFDEQTCSIELSPMEALATEIILTPSQDKVLRNHYTESGEWQILDTKVTSGYITIETTPHPMIEITFILKRLPTFFVVNIILPVILLSFLNILVFLIPVESGEKISFGITVLLALSVFMSIIGGMLPRSSDIIPRVTIYLFVLMIISVLTVIANVLIVMLHFYEERAIKRKKANETFKNVFSKVKLFNKVTRSTKVSADSYPLGEAEGTSTIASPPPYKENLKKNINKHRKIEPLMVKEAQPNSEGTENHQYSLNRTWKTISKNINLICFIVFMFAWIVATSLFLYFVA